MAAALFQTRYVLRLLRQPLMCRPRTNLTASVSVPLHTRSVSQPGVYNLKHGTDRDCLLSVRALSSSSGKLSAGQSGGRVVPFLLSDIGEGIVEVVVKEWYVSVGDSVSQFDNICEVQSDKASVTITSRYDGVIRKRYCDIDEMARVGEPLVDIELSELSEDVPAEGRSQSREAPEVSPSSDQLPSDHPSGETASSVKSSSARTLATPAVRRLAAEHGVPLSQVPASGRDGRVLKDDFLRYLQLQSTTATDPRPADQDAVTQDRAVPFTGFSRVMFSSMTRSLSVPHFGYCDEYDVTALVDLRRKLSLLLSERGESRGTPISPGSSDPPADIKLSLMPFVLKACSLALTQYPQVNAWLKTPAVDGDVSDNCDHYQLIVRGSHDLGVAMDTPAGLVVPCIERVQLLSILQLAQQLQRLQQLGAVGQLSPADLRPASLTVSNIGAVGGTYAHPVISPPQIAIGAVGRVQKLPRFSPEGAVVAANIMPVSWSADHRVLDGATMARFSNLVKSYLERPELMLLHLK